MQLLSDRLDLDALCALLDPEHMVERGTMVRSLGLAPSLTQEPPEYLRVILRGVDSPARRLRASRCCAPTRATCARDSRDLR